MIRFLFWLLRVMLAVSGPTGFAMGQTNAPPLLVVHQFYQPYVTEGDSAPDDLALIAEHATQSLQSLISREQGCEREVQGVCRIDFDPVLGGQDCDFHGRWPKFTTTITVAGERVTAKFSNGDVAMRVVYEFIREGGDWRIDNIRGAAPGMTWNLRALLSSSP
jgi:hypothetical protein